MSAWTSGVWGDKNHDSDKLKCKPKLKVKASKNLNDRKKEIEYICWCARATCGTSALWTTWKKTRMPSLSSYSVWSATCLGAPQKKLRRCVLQQPASTKPYPLVLMALRVSKNLCYHHYQRSWLSSSSSLHQGQELLEKAGNATSALRPPLSFTEGWSPT